MALYKNTFEKLSTTTFAIQKSWPCDSRFQILLKDKYDKVCVVCVKHDIIKVHFLLTVLWEVVWVNLLSKSAWYWFIDTVKNHCWTCFKYSESTWSNISIFGRNYFLSSKQHMPILSSPAACMHLLKVKRLANEANWLTLASDNIIFPPYAVTSRVSGPRANARFLLGSDTVI